MRVFARGTRRTPFAAGAWVLALAIAACNAHPSGETSVPSGPGPAVAATGAPVVPGSVAPGPSPGLPDTRPASPAATSPPPATPAPPARSVDPTGPVFRFDVPVDTTATLARPAGSDLMVVVGAATADGSHHAFRLDAGAGASGSAYRTLAVDGQGVPCAAAPPMRGGTLAAGRQVLQTGPRAVGSTESFWINTGDFTAAGDRLETCTLKVVTPDLYVYLDQKAAASAADHLQALADVFSAIKPRDEAAYGALPGPGPDGESRVFLVISPAVNAFGALPGHEGYFWARDLMASQPHANQHRAVFVADDFSRYPALVVNGVLAHEYQHLLNFTRKTAANGGQPLSEDSWLDEGMAVYAQQVAGYGLPAGDRFAAHDIATFERDQASYGLLDWTGNPTPAFGQSYLFVRYLVDRFGIGILKELVDDPQVGVTNVETVVGRRGTTFAGVFRDWAIANFLNGTPLAANTPYHYNGLDLAANVDTEQMPGFTAQPATGTVSGQLRPWGSLAYRFSGAGPWHLSVGGNPSARLVGGAW